MKWLQLQISCMATGPGHTISSVSVAVMVFLHTISSNWIQIFAKPVD